MEKFLYEMKPYALLVFSIWAYKQNSSSMSGLLWTTGLSILAIYIIYMRLDYRRDREYM